MERHVSANKSPATSLCAKVSDDNAATDLSSVIIVEQTSLKRKLTATADQIPQSLTALDKNLRGVSP